MADAFDMDTLRESVRTAAKRVGYSIGRLDRELRGDGGSLVKDFLAGRVSAMDDALLAFRALLSAAQVDHTTAGAILRAVPPIAQLDSKSHLLGFQTVGQCKAAILAEVGKFKDAGTTQAWCVARCAWEPSIRDNSCADRVKVYPPAPTISTSPAQ